MIENLESPESSYLQTEDMVGRFRRKYSTTSSLYVKTTLHCPVSCAKSILYESQKNYELTWTDLNWTELNWTVFW